MTTDRELLELAAKAAGGIELCFTDQGDWFFFSGRDAPWHPLVDDGDALRLAVKLGLTIECDFSDSDTCTVTETRGYLLMAESSGMQGEVIAEPEFSATRLAIVKAAAAIGRAMS